MCDAQWMNTFMSIATLAVSLVALLVAVLALKHERSQARTHGMVVTIAEQRGNRKTAKGTATGIIGWVVQIDMVGPAGVLQAQPLIFTNGEDDLVRGVVDRQLVPVWSPGDDPLEISIARTRVDALPRDLWVGVTWAEPTSYEEGLISQVRRWPIRLEGKSEPDGPTQRWSHRGKGRWVRLRRPFWRPEAKNRWGEGRKKLPLRGEEGAAGPEK